MSRAVRAATAGLLGLAVLLLLLAAGAVLTTPDSRVTGTVLGRGWHLAGPCQPTVGYEVGGASYRTTPEYDETWCDEGRGDHVAVWVDPDAPGSGRLERFERTPGLLALGAAGALLLAVLVATAERRRALSQDPPRGPGPVPHVAGVLALACLTGQAVTLWRAGGSSADGGEAGLAMLLGGVVVGWVAAGVLRARAFRTAVAWFLLIGGVALSGEGVAGGAIGLRELAGNVLELVLSVTQLAALACFSATRWAAWHRAHPRATGATAPTIEHLVVLAVLVGVLGGLVGPTDDALIRVHVDL